MCIAGKENFILHTPPYLVGIFTFSSSQSLQENLFIIFHEINFEGRSIIFSRKTTMNK